MGSARAAPPREPDQHEAAEDQERDDVDRRPGPDAPGLDDAEQDRRDAGREERNAGPVHDGLPDRPRDPAKRGRQHRHRDRAMGIDVEHQRHET